MVSYCCSTISVKRRVLMRFGDFRTAFINDPSGEPTSSTPTALTETIMSLRRNNATLSEECGSLKGMLEHRNGQLADAERRLASSTSQITRLETSIAKAEEISTHRTRRLALLEQELSSCKALLATFDAEDAAFRDENDAGLTEADRLKMGKRIQDLEQIVLEYKATNNSLQSRISELLANGVGASSGRRQGGDGDTDMADVDAAVREERYAKTQLESGMSISHMCPNSRLTSSSRSRPSISQDHSA